jgi:hypothetical protein
MENVPQLNFSSYSYDFQTKKLLSKKRIEDLGVEKTKKIYELIGINDYLSDKIRIIDENEEDKLYLLHYVIPDEHIYHVRGTIIHITEEGECKIIAESLPYSEDLCVDIISEKKFDENYNVVEIFEGTVIRIFKGPITKRWYFSTHKKIDGRKSRWCGPTFGEIFFELWKKSFLEEVKIESTEDSTEEKSAIDFTINFDSYFEEDKCYVFLLSHPDNKLVCNIEPKLTLISIYKRDEETSRMIHFHFDDKKLSLKMDHPSVDYYDNVQNFSSKEELVEYVKKIPYTQSTGVFVYKYAENLSRGCRYSDYYKLSNNDYLSKRVFRGNEPNLKLRYLEFKLEGSEYLEEFVKLFSEKKKLFDEVDRDFNNLSAYLKKFYNRRYKNREYCVFPQEEHILVENTRKHYDKTYDIQKNIELNLLKCTPRQINTLIKHMKEQ